ncbi:MAG: anhydro-N-acetylmuramic acid kinase [Winogradskyella sp.]|uniref:anhydro-N-acetylmuramic acid kinase n=1 Tax=Winogradskyella sp. TaxID=1883156 RepID=UPI00183DAB6E|nr:anhydro-N-acetylmuramic acid kinase [Winogradskyella sp.]
MLKSNYHVIAVMSGTSLDGVDIIYANYSYTNSWNFKIINTTTIPYSDRWKAVLKNLTNKSIDDLNEIDINYTIYLAERIKEFIKTYKVAHVDIISSHGHTALHQPENKITYQIGNRKKLAEILGEKVICDFRLQDVELGGQGAPLVPIGDRLLFYNYDYCLNLGGFANISFESNDGRMAYDICPVNVVLNHYVSKLDLEYDDKGHLASLGMIDKELLTALNNLDFYKLEAPKSLGVEWVKLNVFPLVDAMNLKTEHILRTFVEHVALQISNAVNKIGSDVLVSGGGAYNDFLMQRIRQFSNAKIIIPNEEIIEFKEALIFGLLGVLRDRNEVNCLSSVTGAIRNHSSGKIFQPNV